jgi:hypothetical protein
MKLEDKVLQQPEFTNTCWNLQTPNTLSHLRGSEMKCRSNFDKNNLLAQLFISVYAQVMCTESPKLSRILVFTYKFKFLMKEYIVFVHSYLDSRLVVMQVNKFRQLARHI